MPDTSLGISYLLFNPHGNLKRRIVVSPFLKVKLLKLFLPTRLISPFYSPSKIYTIYTNDNGSTGHLCLHWSFMCNELYSSILPYFCFNHVCKLYPYQESIAFVPKHISNYLFIIKPMKS